MEQLFSSNVQRLALKQPILANRLSVSPPSAWEFCKTGKREELNLQRDLFGKVQYIHSPQNIDVEIRQWSGMYDLYGVDVLVLYGIGLGYYYKALLDWLKSDSKHHLVIIEDDIGIIQRFLETEIAEKLLEDKQVDLYYIDQSDPFDKTLENIARKHIYREMLFIPIVAYDKEKRASASRINFLLNFKLFGMEIFTGEYLDRGSAFFSNFYQNFLQLPHAFLGNSLYGMFRGVPAIICGAGPSLQKNIEVLKNLKDRALIFAGGTAMNALNAFGFVPHFGLGVDPFPAQFSRLIMNTAFETPFFYRSRMQFQSAQMIQEAKLYLAGATGYPIANWFDSKLGIKYPQLDEGCNVINMSLSVAAALGCNPIIFVGLDLAYSLGQSYSPGIEMHAIHDPKEHFITKSTDEELVLRQDIYGQPVYTLWKWIQESAWFSNFAVTHPHITLLNATEGGIGFSGVPNISLKEAQTLCLRRQFDTDAIIHGAILESSMPDSVNRNRIREAVQEFVDSLSRCSDILQKIYQHDPLKWMKKNNDPQADKDQGLVKLEESLKAELAYKELLQVFDDNYMSYIRTTAEAAPNPSKIMGQLPGRFPYLMEITLENLQYIDAALKRENENYQAHMKRVLTESAQKEEDETLSSDIYRWGDDSFEINDKELNIAIKEALIPENLKVEYYENGAVKLRQYQKEEKLHGPSILFSEEGNILSESYYENGKKIGKLKTFYKNGKLQSLQRFKEGLKDGKQESYYPDGNLKSLITYTGGILNGEVVLNFPDGSRKRELRFKMGKRDGMDRIYSELGHLSIEAEYKDGRPVNKARMWHADGSMAKEIIYSDKGAITRVQRWDKAGRFIPEEKKSLDYFDEVTLESQRLMEAFDSVVANLEEVIEAIETQGKEIQGRHSFVEDLQALKEKIQSFKKIGSKLKQESGIDAGMPEPLWKTPSSKRLMQQYLEVMTGSMQEVIIKIMAEVNTFRKLLRKKDSDEKNP